MQITIEQQTLYGNRIFRPVCEQAKTFASIAQTRTLTLDTLKLIKALGYQIQITHPTQEI